MDNYQRHTKEYHDVRTPFLTELKEGDDIMVYPSICESLFQEQKDPTSLQSMKGILGRITKVVNSARLICRR